MEVSSRDPQKSPPLSREEIIEELEKAQASNVAAYLASIDDVEAELRRLTGLFVHSADIDSTSVQYKAFRIRFRALGPDRWPMALLRRYEQARRWQDRYVCVYAGIPFARDSVSARELGLRALTDRSYQVRRRAHQLLAYSLERSCLPAMRECLETETRPEARDSLMAAITAVERQDHHRYLDRNETGKVHWHANPWDYGGETHQRAFIQSRKRYDRQGWAVAV